MSITPRDRAVNPTARVIQQGNAEKGYLVGKQGHHFKGRRKDYKTIRIEHRNNALKVEVKQEELSTETRRIEYRNNYDTP